MRIARLFAILAVLVTFASAAQANASPPVAHDGVLDLRDWNFSRDGIVGLSGDWSFSWQVFEDPTVAGAPTAVARVPGSWNDAPGKPPGADGFGTYRLRVECSDAARLAILVS